MPKTVGDVVGEITATAMDDALRERISHWPPDLFALTSAVLAESGAYRLVVSPPSDCRWPPDRPPQKWAQEVEAKARDWIDWLCRDPKNTSCPIASQLVDLFALATMSLRELEHHGAWAQLCNVLTLHAIADESCANIGLPGEPPESDVVYILRANNQLVRDGTLSSFDPTRVRILPKLRTPQTGISIRSLSLYTAYTRCEVETKWMRCELPVDDIHRLRLRLLLFPWPLNIKTTDFVPAPGALENMNTDRYGFFDFKPSYNTADLYDTFQRTLTVAQERSPGINAVVLPEGALTEVEFEQLWSICVEKGVHMMLAGVRGDRRNEARLKIGQGKKERQIDSDSKGLIQHKHHRWCLDGSQIQNYGIGDSLSPAVNWWERMDLHQRELTFVALNDSLTLCHLICEDLARIDPVAQVVRAVGPTLLIALLLDGPQMKGRWPGRYSSVLADDPGTSVLTLTALGMARLSRPNGVPVNPTIAFWKDSRTGDREIRIDDNATGVVLTVWIDKAKEFSADGRSDAGEAGRLIYGGIHQVCP